MDKYSSFSSLDDDSVLYKEWCGRYPPELRIPDAVILLTVDEKNRIQRHQAGGDLLTTEEQILAKNDTGREAILQSYREYRPIEIDTSHLNSLGVLNIILTELEQFGICVVKNL
ncbi:hypothetical protein JT359_19470 [Candidatus Poribacteria bacterium]|nr:hypothetical protein [Candidatus Poribacteria bacterium]